MLTTPHGNAKSKDDFVRTNPKTSDKIQQNLENNQQPRAYTAYKTFLEHIATEVDSEIKRQSRIKNIRKKNGIRKWRQKGAERGHRTRFFSESERLLCAKHLKDNTKHYCRNKVGMSTAERGNIMGRLFEENGLSDGNTTIDFDTKSEELDGLIKDKYPLFTKYFETSLKPRLRKYVFQLHRKGEDKKLDEQQCRSYWQNVDPKSTQELTEKLCRVTTLHFPTTEVLCTKQGITALPPRKDTT